MACATALESHNRSQRSISGRGARRGVRRPGDRGDVEGRDEVGRRPDRSRQLLGHARGLAIVADDDDVADVDADFMSAFVRKTDLNSDGVDELLMTTGDMAQGTLIQMAASPAESPKVRLTNSDWNEAMP